jgi:hypothetical protein
MGKDGQHIKNRSIACGEVAHSKKYYVTVCLILLLLTTIFGSLQTYAMGSIIQNRSKDTCNEDCCDSHRKECPGCLNSNTVNIYLFYEIGAYIPKFTFFSILVDIDTISDQGVIKIIPHPPPA